jgi:oxygen-independent coproporphyrinogen-3 oxidase
VTSLAPKIGLAEIDDSAGCYVHLPFCDRICPYCDFAVVRFERTKAARYVAAVVTEIERTAQPSRPVRTVYLGGGTPSALEPAHVGRVLGAVFRTFAVEPGTIECTLEANPSRSPSGFGAWRRAGVTRLSIGVQSLDDGELNRLGRDHSAQEAIDFVAAARREGFADVSIDLIAGVPGQSVDAFDRSLCRAVDAGPDHVSVYGMTIEPGTPYWTWHGRDPAAFPDDDAVADMLDRAHEALVAAGYRHYELSNFARPGHECSHNMGYWRQRECVAFGLSASGYAAGVRFRNVRDYAAYCAAIEEGRSACEETERLDLEGRVGEAAMLALRTSAGIERDDFLQRFGIDVASVFGDALNKCSAAGLIENDARGARLTDRGRLMANAVCVEFLRPHLTEVI